MASNDPTQASTSGQGTAAGGLPGPEMMLGLWSSWMKTHSGFAQDWTGAGKPWWQVTPDDALGNMLAGGVQQLNEMVAKDPMLRAVDDMWNANPLREVIPVDWAGIARSLRTVWLRS